MKYDKLNKKYITSEILKISYFTYGKLMFAFRSKIDVSMGQCECYLKVERRLNQKARHVRISTHTGKHDTAWSPASHYYARHRKHGARLFRTCEARNWLLLVVIARTARHCSLFAFARQALLRSFLFPTEVHISLLQIHLQADSRLCKSPSV